MYVCAESPQLERLQRKECVSVCVSVHGHSSLAKPKRAYVHILSEWWEKWSNTCKYTHTDIHTQPGVSCRPLLLSSLNQIPGTEQFKRPLPSLKFYPCQLMVAVAALVATAGKHTRFGRCPFIQRCVQLLSHRWASHQQLTGANDGPFCLSCNLWGGGA